MGKKMLTIIFFISVDIDNYHDKCQIFISFKFKPRTESRNGFGLPDNINNNNNITFLSLRNAHLIAA